MDEYAEIIFVDEDDLRNARDNRTDNRSPSRALVPRRATPAVIRHSGSTGVVRPRAAVVVSQRVEPDEPKKVLANLTAGQLVELAAQLLATLQPLPAAPVAQGRADTDVQNLITYQNALAIHAKRDEQLRTIGALVGQLVK